jgi:hypothetical protein
MVHTGGALSATEKNDLAAYLLQIDDAEAPSSSAPPAGPYRGRIAALSAS